MPGVLKSFKLGGRGDGHFISGGLNPNKSNEQIVFAAQTAALPAGTIVGKVTASGNYVQAALTGSTGQEKAVGISWSEVPINTSTQRGVIVARDAVVNGNLITFPTGANTTQRAKLIADLAEVGIMVRF